MKKDKYSKLLDDGDNKPTKQALWDKALSEAKSKFDKYPSAYANAWAAKRYKELGGTWKKMADGGMFGGGGMYGSDIIKDEEGGSSGGGNLAQTIGTIAKVASLFLADGGEVTLTPDEMTLVKRRSRQFGELETALAQPSAPPTESGLKGAGTLLADAYKKSDRYRAPEFFQEGYQVESRVEPTVAGGQTFDLTGGGGSDFSSIVGQADGGMVGSLASLTSAVQKQKESPFPEPTEVGMPMENTPSAKLKQPQALAKGGYVVVRSDERKGKTHKVTAPDGSVKFFGDPNLKNRPNNPKAKASWYARHAKSLKDNPHFRAYARSTWADGGLVPDEVQYFQDGDIVQGVQSPVTRELLADSRPATDFPNRAAGDEDELPLPPDLEETEEERKKREEAAKAATAPAPVPVATPVPVPVPVATPAAPVKVEAGGQTVEIKPTTAAPAPTVAPAPKQDFSMLGGGRRDLMVAETGRGMSPLGALREGIKEEDDKEYSEIKRKALAELGGYEKLLEDTPENAKKNDRIIQINAQRRDAAIKIATEISDRRKSMKAAGEAKEQPPAKKAEEAPAEQAETTTPPPPPKTPTPFEAATTAVTAEAKAAAEALQTTGTPSPETIAPPPPFIIIKDAAGREYTAAELNDPTIRYSAPVVEEIKKSGDYNLVFEAAKSVGYSETQSQQIAIDEVLRNKSVAGLGPLPTGMGAMGMARSAPEYETLRSAIAQQALAKLEDARLAERQSTIERQIKDAALDLEIKRIQDYEIKKGAVDAQVAELRRQVLTDQVDPDRFLAGKGISKGFAIALGLLGKGLGAKTSIVDYINERVKEDINLQVTQLGRKNNLITMLVNQGNELEDALKLADAYYKNMFAALIEKSTVDIRDERAKMAALGAAAALQEKGAKDLQTIVEKQVNDIYEPYKIKLQSAGTGVKSAAELLRIKGTIKAAGIRAAPKKAAPVLPPAASPELTSLYKGESLDQGQFAKVNLENKDLRLGEKVLKVLEEKKKTIKMKDGTTIQVTELVPDTTRVLLAYDKTERDKANDATTKGLSFLGKLTRLEELMAKYNYQGSQLLASAQDKGAMEVVMGELATELGVLRNIGVPQEAEYQRIIAALPNMEMLTRGTLTQSKVSEFRNLMIGQIMNARNNYLVGGGLSGTGTAAMPPPVMKAPPVRTAKPK